MTETIDRSPHWLHYGHDQIEIERMIRDLWGDKAFDSEQERGARVGEEAVEIMQASGSTRAHAHKTVDMVYDKPTGELSQEIAGVMFTLLALCALKGVRADDLLGAEIARIKSKDPEHHRRKQRIKADLGASLRGE